MKVTGRLALAFTLLGWTTASLAQTAAPARALPRAPAQAAPVSPPAAPAAPAPAPAQPVTQSAAVAGTGTSSTVSVAPGTSATQILNLPAYAPAKLDFGEVWDGDLAKRTIALTTNAAGNVTLDLPPGPFRVSEFREMGAWKGPSKNSPMPNNGPIAGREVKNRFPYQPGQAMPLQWSLGASVDIQIDVVFQPKFQLGSMMAGQKSTTVKVTGPGPKGNWALTIPAVGMFDGTKAQAPIIAERTIIYAVPGDTGTWINVTLTGLGTNAAGTIRGGVMPPGVTVIPKSVTVPAGQSIKTSVSLSFANVVPDMVGRPLELVFETASGSTKAQLQFMGLPKSKVIYSGQRGDCGVSRAEIRVTLTGPRQKPNDIDERGASTAYEAKGWNLDLIKRRYLLIKVESGGVSVLDDKMVLPERNSDEVKDANTLPYMRSYEDWAKIVTGPARMGCYATEDGTASPNPQSYRWAAASLQ